MWLSLLFGAIVVGSLVVSGIIFFEVVPITGAFLGIVAAFHLLFGWAFLRAYLGYRSVHRLVHEGRGELFDLAIGHRIERERFQVMRDVYRLRRIEGLALLGLAREALDAAGEFRREAKPSAWMKLEALAAEAEANGLLGADFFADRVLAESEGLSGAAKHAGLRAVRARLAFQRGHAEAARRELEPVLGAGQFPLTSVVRARNLHWYADALGALGRSEEAARFYRRAVRSAPRSYWGRSAARHA